jgi:hypothetical protein
MSYNEVVRTGFRFSLLTLFPLLVSLSTTALTAAEAQTKTSEPQPLNEEELHALQSTLTELQSLAPKLRVLLRTLRKQVGFEPREIYNIERAMSQSEKDLERMIAMHRRNAFNKMRAHFMADDLRRKSAGLKDSLGYVKRRIQELDDTQNERQQNADLKKNDDALVEQLGLYSDLVHASVMLLKDEAF